MIDINLMLLSPFVFLIGFYSCQKFRFKLLDRMNSKFYGGLCSWVFALMFLVRRHIIFNLAYLERYCCTLSEWCITECIYTEFHSIYYGCKFTVAILVFCKQIIPSKCRYDVLSTKIEIRLAKAEPIKWKSLEYSNEHTVPQRVNAPGRFIFL